MHRACVALILLAALLGACNGGDSADDDGTGGGNGDTTTVPGPRLEFATPDGYLYTFHVLDERVGLAGMQAVVEIEIANALDTPDRRLNRPHAETRRLMIGVKQERFGGLCPTDRDEPYDYDIYVAAAGYCVITSSALHTHDLPLEAGASTTITLTADLVHTLGVESTDVAVFFFDPLLTLTPVREMFPEGATYDVIQRPECENPVSGELRPECEAAFHPDLLVPLA
jgi:hypothetical protein